MKRADDPTLSPDEADYWLDQNNKEIEQALASNPATPLDHLSFLADTYPLQVVQNPAFVLLAVEDPAQYQELLAMVVYGFHLKYIEAQSIKHLAKQLEHVENARRQGNK